MTLKETVTEFMQRLPGMNHQHEAVDGGDVVEILGEYWPQFKKALKEPVKKRTNSASKDDTIIDVYLEDYAKLVTFAELMEGVLAWAKDHGANPDLMKTLQRQRRAALRVSALKKGQ